MDLRLQDTILSLETEIATDYMALPKMNLTLSLDCKLDKVKTSQRDSCEHLLASSLLAFYSSANDSGDFKISCLVRFINLCRPGMPRRQPSLLQAADTLQKQCVVGFRSNLGHCGLGLPSSYNGIG